MESRPRKHEALWEQLHFKAGERWSRKLPARDGTVQYEITSRRRARGPVDPYRGLDVALHNAPGLILPVRVRVRRWMYEEHYIIVRAMGRVESKMMKGIQG